jgi:hypothetical protein
VAGAAAAGLAAGVTSLLCDQAPLVGSVMSADNNKIREIFMAKSLYSIDRNKLKKEATKLNCHSQDLSQNAPMQPEQQAKSPNF